MNQGRTSGQPPLHSRHSNKITASEEVSLTNTASMTSSTESPLPQTPISPRSARKKSTLSTTTTQQNSSTELNASSILVDTMMGLREAASDTLEGLKEWAVSSPSRGDRVEIDASVLERCHAFRNSDTNGDTMVDDRVLLPDDSRDLIPRPQRRHSPRSGPPANQHDSHQSLIHDLMSPLVACGIMEPRFEKQQRTSKKSASSKKKSVLLDAYMERQFFDDGMSMDSTLEEEVLQLRRLTSWATINTTETDDSYSLRSDMSIESSTIATNTDTTMSTISSTTSLETSSTTQQQLHNYPPPTRPVTRYPQLDDDGNVIPPALLQSAQRRREQRRAANNGSGRRRKVVRFDYPPITRLRECPRPDPKDLPNLFFTEEELDEIEADRDSTITADDVELVAVAPKFPDYYTNPPSTSLLQMQQQQHQQDDTASNFSTGSRNSKTSNNSRTSGTSGGNSSNHFFRNSPRASPPPQSWLDSPVPSNRFGGYQSTPRLKQRGGGGGGITNQRSGTPHPPRAFRAAARLPDDDDTNMTGLQQQQQDDAASNVSSSVARGSNTTSNASSNSRLIKGVQIYLRERSMGRGTR